MRACFARSRLIASVLFFSACIAADGEVPDDLNFQILIKPAGDRLYVLVRAPFEAFGDIQLPLRPEFGNLDLAQIDTVLPGIARWWVADSIELFENGAQISKPEVLETRAAVQSDQSFAGFASALSHLQGERLPPTTQIFPKQAWLDVLLDYPIRSDASSFWVRTRFARFGARVTTDLRFLTTAGAVRSYTYPGDPEKFALDPPAAAVIPRFFSLGFSTVLRSGALVLCLLCLALPFDRPTAMSLTAAFLAALLVALAFQKLTPGSLWFPPLIETLTSASIVYLAFENILGIARLHRRFLTALLAGLLFGFSLSFSLEQNLQFGGAHSVLSAAGFAAGTAVTLVSLAAILLPALHLLLVFSKERRVEIVILSALAAHVSWHWMADSADRLRQFPVARPALGFALVANALQWLALIAVLAGIYWLGSAALRARGKQL